MNFVEEFGKTARWLNPVSSDDFVEATLDERSLRIVADRIAPYTDLYLIG